MKKYKNVYGTYIGLNYFHFYITHKSSKTETVIKEEDDEILVIQASKINKGKNARMSIHCWYGPKNKIKVSGNIIDSDNLIYDSGNDENGSIPWQKNATYEYSYDIKSKKMSIEKLLNEKEGKEILKTTPHRKGSWDSMIDNYDLQCVCGEWASNPSYGQVEESPYIENLFDNRIGLKNKEHYSDAKPLFYFNNKYYKRIDSSDWFVKRFYNMNEWDELRKRYEGNSDYNTEWADFEDMWKQYSKYSSQKYIDTINIPAEGWRDASRKVYHFSSAPVIGTYERVISKGFMTEPRPGTVMCPCCKLIHRVYSETSAYLAWYQKINRYLVWHSKTWAKIYRLFRKIRWHLFYKNKSN